MDYEKAVRQLGRFAPILRKVPKEIQDGVYDIRISLNKPVMLCCGDKILFLQQDGSAVQHYSPGNILVTREDIDEIFLRLCGYSVYSHSDEIRNGFISADRCLRVGLGGTAVLEKGELKTVRDITSLSIRIPREIPGCAEGILRAGVNLKSGVLIAGAPSSGKTTLLRDLARSLGASGRRTVVLDERFEIQADDFDLGACTDVLQGYPKQEGLAHALRCLSPEFILCDELGEDDFYAVKATSFAGVSLIATIHAGSVRELQHRPLCRKMLELGAFRTVILLHGRQHPTQLSQILRAGDLLEDSGSGHTRDLRFTRGFTEIDAAQNA